MISKRVRPAVGLSATAIACLLAGCAPPKLSTVQVTHFQADGSEQSARQSFEQAWCRRGVAGAWQIALCTRTPSQTDPSLTISQIVLLDVVWRPRPGRTLADETMTDALIKYALISGTDAASYEGAGFVSVNEDVRTGRLHGRIESAYLSRRRIRGNPPDVFGGQARLTGEFTAQCSAVEVARLEREVNVALGAPPAR